MPAAVVQSSQMSSAGASSVRSRRVALGLGCWSAAHRSPRSRNARIEQVNTQLRLITRRAYGFRTAEALIALAMLSLGGLCPPLPA